MSDGDPAGRTAATPLVILAGGGRFPLLVAETVRSQGRPVTIAAIRGEANAAVAAFPHVWLGRGQLGTLIALMRRLGARDLVIVGAVRQRRLPRLSELDVGGVWEVIRNWRILRQGDDGLLRKIARLFETRGIRVVGAAEVAPELLMPIGAIGRYHPKETDLADVAVGLCGARAHGADDRGQAVIARDGLVAVKEGPAGTDAMISVFAELPRGISPGVLVKCPKPTQDRRLDMPAIGPDTVRAAAAAGLSGIAVEAGGTIVADRAEVVRLADECGLFVFGVAPDGPLDACLCGCASEGVA